MAAKSFAGKQPQEGSLSMKGTPSYFRCILFTRGTEEVALAFVSSLVGRKLGKGERRGDTGARGSILLKECSGGQCPSLSSINPPKRVRAT